MKNTRLKVNLDKLREWKDRSRKKAIEKHYLNKQPPFTDEQLKTEGTKYGAKIKQSAFKQQRSTKRAHQEADYNKRVRAFLDSHPICPVTGGRTTETHHAAKRYGEWLLLERYWIGVSIEGHKWIENNKKEAEKHGLMIRIRLTYKEHVAKLLVNGESLSEPIFYKLCPKLPIPALVNENSQKRD